MIKAAPSRQIALQSPAGQWTSSPTKPRPSTRCSSRACKHALPGKGQTDFTDFKIIGWGWYYLSTILDDYSRYIIAWKLCTNMRAEDVTDTIKLALTASGCDQAVVRHKPRLLSDNGSCYISGDLAKWLEGQKMTHVRGAPFHTQTQGKIPSRDIAAQYPDGQWNAGIRP